MSTTRKIIVAEDNLADLELAKIALQEIGTSLEVVHVFDGQELINYVQKEPLSNIALILLDLNMPNLGGIDVLKHFYKDSQLKKLPVIVFSSSTHITDIQTCYEYGANAYVSKPIDISDFTKTLSAIANFWGEINVLPPYNATVEN